MAPFRATGGNELVECRLHVHELRFDPCSLFVLALFGFDGLEHAAQGQQTFDCRRRRLDFLLHLPGQIHHLLQGISVDPQPLRHLGAGLRQGDVYVASQQSAGRVLTCALL